MLKDAVGVSKIYIACGYTDLRLGIDGLAFLIQEKFHLTPTEKGTLFLFLLLYKRLAPGFRYQWPRTVAEAKQLTREQFAELMKGFNPLQSGLIGEIHPKRIG